MKPAVMRSGNCCIDAAQARKAIPVGSVKLLAVGVGLYELDSVLLPALPSRHRLPAPPTQLGKLDEDALPRPLAELFAPRAVALTGLLFWLLRGPPEEGGLLLLDTFAA